MNDFDSFPEMGGFDAGFGEEDPGVDEVSSDKDNKKIQGVRICSVRRPTKFARLLKRVRRPMKWLK